MNTLINRTDTKTSFHSALRWIGFWVGAAAAFAAILYYIKGPSAAIDFVGGYLTEFSLSIDNIFLFLLVFTSFNVPVHAQHRVLKWGIIGAIVLRFIFIFFGLALVNRFEWVLYLFGAVLVYNGVKMGVEKENAKDPHESRFFRLLSRLIPISKEYDGEKFITRKTGKRMLTPLMAVLLLIEFSDIVFAIDSVPAVLSISRDLLIVYSSNIFAILGLRQLFFVVEHMNERFSLVRYGVAVILVFTGTKMLLGMIQIQISTIVSIGFIVVTLTTSILASGIINKRKLVK